MTFLAISIVLIAFSAPYAQVTVARDMNAYLRPDDIVGTDGFQPETVLLYVQVEKVKVVT